MAQESSGTIGRFDQVFLVTTKNVSYISMETDELPTPEGAWTVVASIENDVLLTKDRTVIRLPSSDVLKIMDYDKTMKQVFSYLGDMLNHGQREKTTREPKRAP